MKKQVAISQIDPRFLNGIAHRGLHDDTCTENGLTAFKKAIDQDVAFEFDVHLTKDGELVICHDEELERTTGKKGIIEDLTLQEIRDNYRLLDGGVVPTLQEVFELNDEKVPMVLELKVFRKNYTPLAARVKEALKVIRDKRKLMLISFDPRSLWPFKHDGFIRSLLVVKSDEYTWFFRHTVESVDLDMELFKERRVRRYVKKHFTNAWTVENEGHLDYLCPFVDTVTFQYISPKIVKERLNKK